MTSKDGSDANDQTGPLGPDQVTTPPLQHQGPTMDASLVASLIDGPPKSGDPEEQALELDTSTADQTPAPDAAEPEASADAPDTNDEGEQQVADPKPDESGKAPEPDPYLKQLSQQFATLSSQVTELKDSIGKPQPTEDAKATAEAQEVADAAQDKLDDVLADLNNLEEALDKRDEEFGGVEPSDLKAAIKAMGGIVKRVHAIEAKTQQAQQAASQAARQTEQQSFFQAEDQANPGIDSKAIWSQASADAQKYVGDYEPGTDGYKIAQNYAQTRYGELKELAIQTPANPDTPPPADPPAPVKPPATAGTKPRTDPKGTVTQPPGARPAAPSGKRDTQSIIGGLITPD